MNTVVLIFLLFSPTVIIAMEEEIIWEIPFEKSKVNYHRTKVCITIKGVTNCVSKNKEPGDPLEVAKMFQLQKKTTQIDSESGDSTEPPHTIPDFPEGGSTEDGGGKDGGDEDKKKDEEEEKGDEDGDEKVDKEALKAPLPDQTTTEETFTMTLLETTTEETPEIPKPILRTNLEEKNLALLHNIDYWDLNRKWSDDPKYSNYRRRRMDYGENAPYSDDASSKRTKRKASTIPKSRRNYPEGSDLQLLRDIDYWDLNRKWSDDPKYSNILTPKTHRRMNVN